MDATTQAAPDITATSATPDEITKLNAKFGRELAGSLLDGTKLGALMVIPAAIYLGTVYLAVKIRAAA